MVERIRITAKLKSPLILGGGFLTFDALLASLIFETESDIEIAHNTIPLSCTNGLFHASAALLEPVESQTITFVANLRAGHSLDPALLQKNKEGTVHATIGLKRRREFGPVANAYKAFTAPEVVWYAEGDVGLIKSLIQSVPFIGARRGSGYGEVAEWIIASDQYDGIVGPFGAPLRPVPIEMFDGDKGSLKVDAAWRPAYWDPENRAICYAPPFIA